MDWFDNTWASSDDGPWNEGPPSTDGVAFFTNAATVLTLKGPTPGFGNFVMFGGKLILADDAVADTCGSITANGHFIMGGEIEVTAKRRKKTVTIAARPYMNPAMERELPKLPEMWKNSIF